MLPPPEGAIEVERGADQSEMRKGLREIAERLALGAGLFGVEAEVIGVAEHAFEEEARFVKPRGIGLTRASECFDEPEGAHVEGALFAGETVDARLRRVSIDQAVADESAIARVGEDGFDGADHSRIDGRHEKNKRHD